MRRTAALAVLKSEYAVFNVTVEYCCHLSSCCACFGHETAVGRAVYYALCRCPGYGSARIGRDAFEVRKAAEVGCCRYVDALEGGVAIKYSRHLLARDGPIGGEGVVIKAVDYAVCCRPADSLAAPNPRVSEKVGAAALGLPSMRHRTVTSMPRVMVTLGENVFAPVPANRALL